MSRRLYFFLFQRKFYILFSISCLIFCNSINLAFVSQLRNEDLVSDYIFISQRESQSVPDMGLSRIDLPKLTSSILMKTVTIPVVLIDEFYFYIHHPIKLWLFEKIIFELVYLFHIVLKSLASY